MRRAEPAGRTLAVAPGGPAAWGVQTCAQRGGSRPARNRGLLRSPGAPSPLCLHKGLKGAPREGSGVSDADDPLHRAVRHPLDPAPVRAKMATLGESPLQPHLLQPYRPLSTFQSLLPLAPGPVWTETASVPGVCSCPSSGWGLPAPIPIPASPALRSNLEPSFLPAHPPRSWSGVRRCRAGRSPGRGRASVLAPAARDPRWLWTRRPTSSCPEALPLASTVRLFSRCPFLDAPSAQMSPAL